MLHGGAFVGCMHDLEPDTMRTNTVFRSADRPRRGLPLSASTLVSSLAHHYSLRDLRSTRSVLVQGRPGAKDHARQPPQKPLQCFLSSTDHSEAETLPPRTLGAPGEQHTDGVISGSILTHNRGLTINGVSCPRYPSLPVASLRLCQSLAHGSVCASHLPPPHAQSSPRTDRLVYTSCDWILVWNSSILGPVNESDVLGAFADASNSMIWVYFFIHGQYARKVVSAQDTKKKKEGGEKPQKFPV